MQSDDPALRNERRDAEPADHHAVYEKIPKGRGLWQLAAVLLFVAGTYSLNYLFQLSKEPPKIASTGVFKPTVEAVKAAPSLEKISYRTAGEVRARNFVTITPEIAGRVIATAPNFRVGALVPAGSVLFRIDPQEYQTALASAEAGLLQAQAGLKPTEAEAKAAVAEWKLLYPDRPAPPNVAKEPQLAQAKAAIAVAQAGVESAKLNLKRTEYRLPFAGYPAEIAVEVGQYVRAGSDYGKIFPLSATEITAEIDQKIAERLKASGQITATLRMNDETGKESLEIPLKFNAFAPVLKEESRLSKIIFTPVGAVPSGLLPGMFVTLNIREGKETLLYRAPSDVLESGKYLRLLDHKNRVRRREPQIFSREGEEVLFSVPGESGELTLVRGAVIGMPDGAEAEIFQPEAVKDTAVENPSENMNVTPGEK